MRSVLILNPTSGFSPLAAAHGSAEECKEQILTALRAQGIEPEVWYTSEDDYGDGLARRAAADGVDLVIAAGGDGTLHAVACGLAGTSSALGIIPLGTMNNVARSLKIPEDIEGACAIIGKGATHKIDMGILNNTIFLEVAGIGLEAALFPAAEEIKRTGFWSTMHGAVSGFLTLLRFRPTRFIASFNGRRPRRFHAIQISICNSPFYGARLQFAPHAIMDDGLLDVLIYKNFSKLEYIRHAISISQGKRSLTPKVKRLKITSMDVRTEEPIPLHADGEAQGNTPAHIRVQPGVLRVRVPQQVAAGPNVVHPSAKQRRRSQPARASI